MTQERGCDVLKSDWNTYTYRPTRDAIEDIMVKVISERESDVLATGPTKKKRRVMSRSVPRCDQLNHHIFVPRADEIKSEIGFEEYVTNLASNVTLLVQGGKTSKLFLSHKGKGELERVAKRFEGTLEEAVLDVVPPEEESSGIERKRLLIEKAKASTDQSRDLYMAKVNEGRLLRRKICILRASLGHELGPETKEVFASTDQVASDVLSLSLEVDQHRPGKGVAGPGRPASPVVLD